MKKRTLLYIPLAAMVVFSLSVLAVREFARASDSFQRRFSGINETD
jgi:hypothetical protein